MCKKRQCCFGSNKPLGLERMMLNKIQNKEEILYIQERG